MGRDRLVSSAALAACLVLAVAAPAAARAGAAAAPPLAQGPTLSRTHVVFTYGGFLWSAPRAGGEAKRLTDGGSEGRAFFSPDGKWIAYTRRVDRNDDVYVMPAEGGAARRLTWHPGADTVVGWTPDSQRILFSSTRETWSVFDRLYTVPLEGGAQTVLPMWRGEAASYSPDGQTLAYVPNAKWQKEWKRYRGGQTTPIYVARLSDLHVDKVPRQNSNDSQPAWFGGKVYFLSDRDGPVSLYAYDPRGKRVTRVLANTSLDFKTLSAGPDALVYEQFGDIHLFDPATGQDRKVEVTIPQPLAATQPQAVRLASRLYKAALSPTGDQVAFEARGEIVVGPTAPGGKAEDLTQTDKVAERDPAWSPDGKTLAYLSDETGEYGLRLRDIASGVVRKIDLGAPSFFQNPLWSPDGRRILIEDARQILWMVEVDSGRMTKVDEERHTEPEFAPSWSPDGRWVAYALQQPNFMYAVQLFEVATGKRVSVTDGMADARQPVFDRSGRWLYFTLSTDVGLASSPQDMTRLTVPVTRNIYAAVLAKGDVGPEGAAAAKPPAEAGRVDLDGLATRLVPLSVPAANYTVMAAGPSRVLLLQQAPPTMAARSPGFSVLRADLAGGGTQTLATGLANFEVSADGEKILYRQRAGWVPASTATPVKPTDPALDFNSLQVRVDPRNEWRQMFREVWRQERDYFYDPKLHGLDLGKVQARYAPYVERVGSREDLNYLFREMTGDLTVGHMFVGDDGKPFANAQGGGLLGADYVVDHDRYRFSRIYRGDVWAPGLAAPLGKLGLDVTEGDYLIAVEGQRVRASDDLYKAFQDTAGIPTKITVAKQPDGQGARELMVTPIADEAQLRLRAWEEDNRRKVDTLSGGRIAYVHLPDTKFAALSNFTRFYYAQVGKDAVIMDNRFNQGGHLADEVVDRLGRRLRNCTVYRYGEDICTPNAAIYGPKTMIINEMSGSGGEALPWMFRQDGLGPLVGTRTWGGITAGGAGPLLDGSGVAAPNHGSYGADGHWDIENQGLAPDVEVENDPASVAAGHDPQLEAAVRVTLEALKRNPPKRPKRPPFPSYQRSY